MHPDTLPQLGIIGLGYVGLPLAVEFARHFPTTGYDIDPQRIAELQAGLDRTQEVSPEDLRAATGLHYTADPTDLAACTVYIITVPTPVNAWKSPDFGPLVSASTTVGQWLQRNNVVIYESTVYPGATEEVCVPLLEKASGLRYNTDFFVGYSPERINPGDKTRRVTTICKITSGSTPEAADFIGRLYRTIITAGTHPAPSIRVAEAAKVIENTQRDVNIALINELAVLFHRLGLDTEAVLQAAGSKWNFLPFRPGLVGGHCIGVDPYYLTHKAQAVGYYPEIILAARRINDHMGAHIAQRVVKLMTQRRIPVVDARILILGFTFKENCPDIRNTRVIDIVHEFRAYHAQVDIYDPWVSPAEAQREYSITPIVAPQASQYDAIILAVAHDIFRELGVDDIRAFGKTPAILFDVKSLLPGAAVDGRL